jgi:hypothetical protein
MLFPFDSTAFTFNINQGLVRLKELIFEVNAGEQKKVFDFMISSDVVQL